MRRSYVVPLKFFVLAVVLALVQCISLSSLPVVSGTTPRHIILMIGDGMGSEQVKAAGMYANGAAGTLSFESFAHTGYVTTRSANSAITDSAASGTAMATGVKVNNGVVSVAADGTELETLLEHYSALGLSTGLVTTTYMTHATPAVFGAHNLSRNQTADIGSDYLTQTRPDVLLGGGANGLSVASAQGAGYEIVTTAAGMASVDTEAAGLKLSGQFGASHLPYELDGLGSLPDLSNMTQTALDVLDNNATGFFLMVEGGRIDHACHGNDLERTIHETIEFSNSVQVVLNWAAAHPDTLIIVTADHETGGLKVTGHDGIAGHLPTVTWSTGGHTATNVPVYAWGVGADRILPLMDNTDVYTAAFFEPIPIQQAAGIGLVGLALLTLHRRRSAGPSRHGLR